MATGSKESENLGRREKYHQSGHEANHGLVPCIFQQKYAEKNKYTSIYIYIHVHIYMNVCTEGEKGGEEKEKKREREGELTAYKALSQTLWQFILWSNC